MSLFGVTVLVAFFASGAIMLFAWIRSRLPAPERRHDVAEAQLRSLAANWAAVERAAERGGMGAEEIAEARRKILGG